MDWSQIGWTDVATLLASLAAVAWLLRRIFSGNDERVEEDSARRFFDEHGHWPDETAGEVAERARLSAETARRSEEAARSGAGSVSSEDRPAPPRRR